MALFIEQNIKEMASMLRLKRFDWKGEEISFIKVKNSELKNNRKKKKTNACELAWIMCV